MALTSVPAAVPRTAAGRRWLPFAVRLLLDVTVAAAIAVFAFLAVGPRVLPYQTVTMLTGSMRPMIEPGSVAVEVSEPVAALRPGQVISFHAPVSGHPVVTHRVVSVRRVSSQVLVQTRGDANSGNDPWTAVVHGARVWQVRAVIPWLGSALRMLRQPTMHAVVGYVAPAALLCWFVAEVWRRPEGGHRRCEHELPPAYPSSRLLGSPSSLPLRSRSSGA
jgi:signal peptidase